MTAVTDECFLPNLRQVPDELRLMCAKLFGPLLLLLLFRATGTRGDIPADLPVLPGTVTRVIDGDTAEVQLASGRIRVRFHGIDAPEGNQPHGSQATAALAAMIGQQQVEVSPVEHDGYDRLVAVVYVGGTNVNAAMLEAGHAWAYRRYLGQLEGDREYCVVEAAARRDQRGLWALPVGERAAPWEYRALEQGRRNSLSDYSDETAAQCIAAIHQRPGASRLPGPGAGCLIKGNISARGERIYHLPGSRAYKDTVINRSKGERWFCTGEEARAAGWRPAR